MFFFIGNPPQTNFWTIAAAIGSLATAGTFIFIIIKYIKDKRDNFWEQFHLSIQEVSHNLNIIKNKFIQNTYECGSGITEETFPVYIKQCGICCQDIFNVIGSIRYFNVHYKISQLLLVEVVNQIQSFLAVITREPKKCKTCYKEIFPYIDYYMQKMILFLCSYVRDFTILSRRQLMKEKKRQKDYLNLLKNYGLAQITEFLNNYLKIYVFQEMFQTLLTCINKLKSIYKEKTD